MSCLCVGVTSRDYLLILILVYLVSCILIVYDDLLSTDLLVTANGNENSIFK